MPYDLSTYNAAARLKSQAELSLQLGRVRGRAQGLILVALQPA